MLQTEKKYLKDFFFLNSIIKIDINNKLNPLLDCLISLKVSNQDSLRQCSSRVRRYPKKKILIN